VRFFSVKIYKEQTELGLRVFEARGVANFGTRYISDATRCNETQSAASFL